MSLALNGDTAKIVRQLIQQFEKLDKAVNAATESLTKLNAATAGLARHAREASRAYSEIASSAEKAARASRGITPGRPAAGGPLVRLPAPLPPSGSTALVPYRSASRDYTTQGAPYTPYGTYPTTPPRRGPGGALVPYGAPSGGDAGGGGGGFTLGGSPYDQYEPGAVVPYSGRQIPLNYRPDRLPADQRYMMRPGPGHSDPYAAGLASAGGLKIVEDTLKTAATVSDLQHRLAGQGFDPDQQQQARDKAFNVMNTVQGSNVIENLKMLSEIQSVLQNPAESLAVLPDIARLNVALGRTTGSKVGGEALAAMKGAEYRAAFTTKDPKTGESRIDPDKVAAFTKAELVTSAVTGGLIDPRALLQFLRSAGAAGANLSDPSFFTNQLPLISALGASGAGRALKGLEQQVGGGKMSEAAANLWIEMGILQGGGDAKHNKFMRKSGMGQFFVDPRAYPPGVQMEGIREPEKFVSDYLFPKIEAYLSKILGDRYKSASPEDRGVMEQNFAQQIASRIPGGTEMAEIVRVKALIDRDKKAWATASKLDLNSLLTQNNPIVAGQGFEAALQGLQVAVGSPAMQQTIDSLNKLSGALNAVSDWSGKHGPETKVALDGITAAFVALGAGSIAKLALALGPVPAMFAAVAGGAVVMTKAFEKLDAWLKGAFPQIFTNKGLEDIQQHGIVKPWWLPGSGPHDPTPPWVSRTWHELGIGSAQGAEPSHAPMPTLQNQGARNTPVPVHITNPGDLAHATGQGLAHSMNTPLHGVSGFDPSTSDLGGLWVGAGPLAQ